MQTVDPIDPAEIRELLNLVYQGGLDKPLKLCYGTSHTGESLSRPAPITRKHVPARPIEQHKPIHAKRIAREHLSVGGTIKIVEQYLELARHAPDLHAMGYEPVTRSHSTGDAPYSWRWAAEVCGALWKTGDLVYGVHTPPLRLVLVRAVIARGIRDRATVMLRNLQARRIPPADMTGHEKQRDAARRVLARLTRPDSRDGNMYGRELVTLTDLLECCRVRVLRV